ncbi:MAG: ChaN family lipoprotein [bacterium]|nr:ChaN family lipoprotein [bacterium]
MSELRIRHLPFLLLASLLATACATPRIVRTVDDYVDEVRALVPELVKADVLALGEHHNTPSIHRTHLELIQAVHRARPNLVIALEMFERDVQTHVDQYLAGLIDETTFLEKSRPWPDYARDYRPVIEFARANGIVVLAANAPRPLARKVAFEGIDAAMGSPHVARETSAPEDGYWDAFVDAMDGHGGMVDDEAIARFYAAQCLKDDTMAESITDYLAKFSSDRRPLAVLICGKMHSDYRRGTVQRIAQRMPEAEIRVFSVEVVDDLQAGVYSSPRDVADYVIVTDEKPPEPKMRAAKKADDKQKGEGAGDGDGAGQGEGEAVDNSGLRPALGFMPGYGGSEAGLLVDAVRDGGPADQAGIKDGDVIFELAGFEIADINDYADVLNELVIGKKTKVRLKRDDKTIELEVVVGSRAGR